ncbi:hypothetical protein MTBBW1_1310006 [Desulfamplus magnetovallimortis]|uniref:PAC domain-containing protein n=1 Tax=Desulfamplus magnetovallimortis TaxID=1246637 RepID=A0A1W1H7F7_9BACT|nr:PAS domain S-box protein [Desulfamplus magnetovallimortis]SLM28308.1 hypothetical protein MTBBW1_1310006 [Desulfamplus magnetovallimortis]
MEEQDACFRVIFDNAGVGIATLNEQRQFICVNEMFLNFSGYQKEELQHLVLMDILQADHAEKLDKLTLKQIQGTMGKVNQECCFVRKDGEERWADLCISPVRNEENGFTAAVMTVSDITAQKRADAERAQRMRSEKAVIAISQALMSAGGEAVELERILQQLVIAAQVDRVYVFQNNSNEDGNIIAELQFEACAPGVPSLTRFVGATVRSYKDDFGRWQKELSRGNHIKGVIDGFPKNEQVVLKKQNSISLLILPLQVEGKWYGFIGFEDTYTRRFWSQTDEKLLGATAEMIGVYIAREQTDERIRFARDAAEDTIKGHHQIFADIRSGIKHPINSIIENCSRLMETDLIQHQQEYLKKLDEAANSLQKTLDTVPELLNTEIEKEEDENSASVVITENTENSGMISPDNNGISPESGLQGDFFYLENMLEQLSLHLKKKKAKLCKEVMVEIMKHTWPDENQDRIDELDELVGKYNFKDASEIVEDMLFQLGMKLMSNRHV